MISAINVRLGLLNSQDTEECESALEALGQIGACKYLIIFQIIKLLPSDEVTCLIDSLCISR